MPYGLPLCQRAGRQTSRRGSHDHKLRLLRRQGAPIPNPVRIRTQALVVKAKAIREMNPLLA